MLDSTRPDELVRSRSRRRTASPTSSKAKTTPKMKKKAVEPVEAGDSRIQWTVKGVDKETLEASRIAARKRGMKFGAWVNEVLRAATTTDETPSPVSVSNELLEKIAEIEFKLDQSVGELKQQTSNIQHDVRVLHMLVPKAAAS